MSLHDRFGQEIKPGVYVAYPFTTRSHRAFIRIGKVLETHSDKWCVTVRGVAEWNWSGEVKLLERNGTLTKLSQVIVLSPETMSQKYKDLLEPIVMDVKQ
jgi:hypothetical protein